MNFPVTESLLYSGGVSGPNLSLPSSKLTPNGSSDGSFLLLSSSPSFPLLNHRRGYGAMDGAVCFARRLKGPVLLVTDEDRDRVVNKSRRAAIVTQVSRYNTLRFGASEDDEDD